MKRAKRPVLKSSALLVLVGMCAGVAVCVHAQEPSSLRSAIELRYPGGEWVSTADLAGWMARPAATRPVILDVRRADEFAVSHLQGARRVEPDRPRVEELNLQTGATVVVYCSVGYRSAAIIEALRRTGVGRVYNLVGGIFQWANEGRPLFRGRERVEHVHPYDSVWGRWLEEARRAPRTSGR